MQVKNISHKINSWCYCLVGVFAITVIFILPVTSSFSAIPGDLGDARFNSVVLEHFYLWVRGEYSYIWSPTFFYPFKETLAFSDNHFGTAIIYSFFRIIGLERESAFLGWFTVGVLLNYLSAYYVLKKLGFSSLSSVCGAIIFSISLPTIFKTAHAQLTYRFGIPLAFWFMYSWLFSKNIKYFIVFGLILIWQFFASIYLGLFLTYFLLSYFIIHLIICYQKGESINIFRSSFKEDVIKRFWLLLLLATGSFLLIFMLYKYASVGELYNLHRSPTEIKSMLPRIGSYFINDQSFLYHDISAGIVVPMRHEHQMFIGVIPGLLLILGVYYAMVSKTSTFYKTAFFSMIFLILFTLSVNDHSIYGLVYSLPGISSVRAVSRIILVILLPASILISLSMERITNWISVKYNNKISSSIGVLLILLLLSEIYSVSHYNTPIQEWKNREDAVVSKLPPKIDKNNILLVTWGGFSPRFLFELDAMIVSQDLKIPTLNGYSGNVPSNEWSDAVYGYGCTTAKKRLQAYGSFEKDLTKSELIDLENLTVTVSPERCYPDAIVQDVVDSQIKNINLSPALTLDGVLKVTITNSSDALFSTFTPQGPIRLSWIITRKEDDSPTHWDTRKDLAFHLKPGESISENLLTDLPTKPGRYILQVSLVQEHVRWFHESGMEIGKLEFKIN